MLSVDDGKAARFGDVQSLEPLGWMFSRTAGGSSTTPCRGGRTGVAERRRVRPGVSFRPRPAGPSRWPRFSAGLVREGDELSYVEGGGTRLAAVRVEVTGELKGCRSGRVAPQASLSLKLAAQTTTRSAGVPGSRFDRRDVSTIQRGCAR